MKRWIRNLLIVVLLVILVAFVSIIFLEETTKPSGGALGITSVMSNFVIDVASRAGYLGIFVLMLFEAAAFPVPSEVVLPLAGYLVSRGVLEFWLVVFYSTVAALIGSFIDYFLGWKFGGELLAGRWKLPYVEASHLRRAQGWFDKYGPVAVAFFRLVPAARVLISFPAGAYRMGKRKFAAYTLAGCLPWNITLVYLGWWLGSSWTSVVAAFRYINLAVYGLLIVIAVWIGWRLLRSDRRGSKKER